MYIDTEDFKAYMWTMYFTSLGDYNAFGKRVRANVPTTIRVILFNNAELHIQRVTKVNGIVSLVDSDIITDAFDWKRTLTNKIEKLCYH